MGERGKTAEDRLLIEAAQRGDETAFGRLVEELSTPEVAAQLGITQAAVRQRLRRARRQMQEEVERIMAEVIRDEAPGAEFGEEVTTLIRRARELLQQVQYRAAAPILESARQQAPTHALVSLLLADAYIFTRTREELEADRGAYDRALALLDEVMEREPDNTLARLRRAAGYAIMAPAAETIAEQRRIAEGARGGPFAAGAELELARRYLALGQGQEALALYGELEKRHDWLACVLHSEMGLACAMAQDGARDLEHFGRAVELTTPAAVEALRQTSVRLLGEAYWACWGTVDNLPARQCQNHAWPACTLQTATWTGPAITCDRRCTTCAAANWAPRPLY